MTKLENVADWLSYYSCYEKFKTQMKSLLSDIVEPFGVEVFEDTDAEDYGYHAELISGERKLYLSLELWDSGSADDGEYGIHGNIHYSAIEFGGLIIDIRTPHNYTKEVWVDYQNHEEFARRLELFRDALVSIKDVVRNWIEGEI